MLLLASCVLASSISLFAQDATKQDGMQKEETKQSEMKQDSMGKDEMKQDAVGTTARRKEGNKGMPIRPRNRKRAQWAKTA